MKKLKLNIQYFGSTNHTQYYDLSQYIATDKPTYLVDYNGDMLKIDNALYSANQKSLENEASIGTLSDLTTTNKSSLVNAVNEVNTQVVTNTSNISQNTLDISANSTAIGTLADLSTTNKSNLVNAVNELKGVNDTQTQNISQNTLDIASNTARIENFNLTRFESITTGTNTGTGSINSCNITVATNEDRSLCKIYGNVGTTDYVGDVIIQTSLRPDTSITVANTTFRYRPDNDTMGFQNITINTDGTVRIPVNSGATTNSQLIPVLIFVKDFGDIPTPVNP